MLRTNQYNYTTQCRYAQSLGGGFDGTPNQVWGTSDYTDKTKPVIFCGLYDLRDYIALWKHRGKAYVFWCGGDVLNIRSNFIFNDGKLLWLSQLFSTWGNSFRDWLIKKILSKADHWCENEAEAWQLKDCGLKVSGICPSFFGNVKKYKISFRQGNNVYLSANKGREQEYGWGLIMSIAWALPEINFHLFGTDWREFQENCNAQKITYRDIYPNVFIHGKVPIKKMNKMMKTMQCGLRLNKHDGFSEITAKSVLWGQYPITYLYHEKIDQFADGNHGFVNTSQNMTKLVKLLKQIPKKTKPNTKARDYYLKRLNQFPWNAKLSKK